MVDAKTKSGRVFTGMVIVGSVLGAGFLYLAYSRPRPPECTLNLSMALDRSRDAIVQGSSEDATARCAVYRAHMALLESNKRCLVSVRSIGPLDSEMAAYQRLITQTCTS